MITLIHDIEDIDFFQKNKPDDLEIIFNDGKITPCICCFGCWIKTPGQCVIKDGYENMGALLSKSNKVIIISKCVYGGFSPFVKNVLDKSISYVLPYFEIKNGETHHKKRYDNSYELVVHFYGKIMESEKETAKKLLKANERNFYHKTEVHFYESPKEIKGVYP